VRSILLLVSALTAPPPTDPLEPIGRLSDPTIKETSGIVPSRKYPGVFWILSDSGNPPAIHAIRRDGRVLASFRVAAPNVDWEEIATDGAGHLYLGDIGNNGAVLPLRVIYRIDEPDPARPSKEPIPISLATHYTFASKAGRFDAESLWIEGKRAVVIAKRTDGRDAELYAIPLDAPAPLLRPTIARRVGTVPGFVEPATGSALAADGHLLAVVSTRTVRVYDRDTSGGLTPRATVRYKELDVEAIAWDGPDLLLAAESGKLFRLPRAAWEK
jgi:hypothetical protein